MTEKIRNRSFKRKFTEVLSELLCQKKFDLQNSLCLIKNNKSRGSKQISLAAENIYDKLLTGVTFSEALRLCPYIVFDTVYISFIRFAERSGSLDKTLIFLKNKCIREEENYSRVVQASVYPVFIIILAIFAAFFLYGYVGSFNSEEESFFTIVDSDFYSSLLFSFLFLILFCLLAFYFLKKTLGINKLYEAFLAMGFLIKGGESIANAVSDAVSILGFDTKEGRLFAEAGEKLSYGLGLKDSFALNSWNDSLRFELEEAFFYAEHSGGENDVFERIALWLNTRDEKRRALCFRLLEPFFITGTGIFLLIFLMNLVLPMFSEMTMFM